MNMDKVVHVSIGEVKVGKDEDILMASLGSCVGIGFIWKRKNLFGLAHCLLPEASLEEAELNLMTARYVSQAVPSLMKLMNIERKNRGEIDAVLAGGGNMTAPKNSDPTNLIGTLNANAAEKYLKQMGIQVVAKELGGETGRKIYLFCQTAEFTIKKISRIDSRKAG
ncbi:MAG: chemotaxis protein CheD [Bdellovibrio sp.]|nr:chemotaxis protein CheD [Bdellovibrio sp.]